MSHLSTVLVGLSLAALSLLFVRESWREREARSLALHLGAVLAA